MRRDLFELWFIKNVETPFLKIGENIFLATTERKNPAFPVIRITYIDKNRDRKDYQYTILPLYFVIVGKPEKKWVVKVSRRQIENLLKGSFDTEKEFLKEEIERLKPFFFFQILKAYSARRKHSLV